MKKRVILSVSKCHIRRGDRVRIIAGNDKGKEGRVLRVYPRLRRAFVEGCQMVKRHRKPDSNHPTGQIEEKEAAIHLSNLMLLDSKGQPTRIGRKLNEQKKWQRYSKKTGQFIHANT